MVFHYGSLGWLVHTQLGTFATREELRAGKAFLRCFDILHIVYQQLLTSQKEIMEVYNIISNKAILPPKKKEKLNLNLTKTLDYQFTDIERGMCLPQGCNQSNPYCGKL